MANGLGRWMDGMQGGMGHQGHIAARVKLIEVQIEGFKVCMCAWWNQEECLRITALTYSRKSLSKHAGTKGFTDN